MQRSVLLPDEFLAQIELIMPSDLNMKDFIASCGKPLRKSIRVNTLKVSVSDFKKQIEGKGWQLENVPWCDTGFWLTRQDETVPLGNTAEHLAGLFYIQEASSMMPVTALLFHNRHLNLVLDVAAAPGSKTTQMAAAMNNEGAIIANEFSSSRVKVLSANAQRCGVKNVALTHFDGRVFGSWLPETFDAILLDAPCSGEGTIRKDPNAMKNWSLASTDEIAETQKELIESAFYALKPGGTLVYSTCTLNHQENQAVCHHLKNKFTDAVSFEPLTDLFPHADKAITQEGFLHIFPQIYDSEGFFVARLKKTASVPLPEVKKRLGKFPFSEASKKDQTEIKQALKDSLNLTLDDTTLLWRRDNEIWLFPSEITHIIGKIRLDRIGIKLADIFSKGKKTQYRWQHQAIVALTPFEHSCMLEISKEQARDWYMGRDIRIESDSGKGEVIVSYQGYPIGIGKWVGNRIKNTYPRELVHDTNLF